MKKIDMSARLKDLLARREELQTVRFDIGYRIDELTRQIDVATEHLDKFPPRKRKQKGSRP